jgi:2',3'-cyclic-nucleotide 2'-phosphodiesterase/3'-nucleotidase
MPDGHGRKMLFHSDKLWTRRDFLKLAGRAGLIGAVPTLVHAAELIDPDKVCISILHTTDLHGHILPTSDYTGNADLGGMARCVTQIRKWRRENSNSLLIDVGDVYQGTDLGLRSKGELMIDLFNHFQYDAWIVGNHEFDWGIEPFQQALARSTMPVLAANTLVEGRPSGQFSDASHPFARIQPFILKEIAGIKIAIIGVTTPGMPFWFRPDFVRGIEFQYPVEPVRHALARAKSEGANAIVLSGHMGLKARTGGDDFANSVTALSSEFPDAVVFIAGHTHQAIPSRLVNGVLFTQADHFGIHVGRVDLFFDRHSKKLLNRRAYCELMDRRLALDEIVLSRTKAARAESDSALSEPIGDLTETLRARGHPGRASDVERLIGTAIIESLYQRGVQVAGSMHGVFDDEHDLVAGRKTVADIWSLLPFENYVVTAELAAVEIVAVMEEVFQNHEDRNLMGFAISIEGRGAGLRITSIALEGGKQLERDKKYLIAFNTFDSRSAGHRFMKLRALLETPAAKCTLHPVQTRDAVIDYFRRHKIVGRITVAPPAMLGLAA